MLLSRDRAGGVLLLLFCLVYAWRSQHIVLLPFQSASAFHARTMPEMLSVIGIGLALWCIARPSSGERLRLRGFDWRRSLPFLPLMSVYGLLLRPVGFLIATSLFLIIGFAILGERRPIWLVGIAVPLVGAFWLLMTEGLDVYLAPLPAMMGR